MFHYFWIFMVSHWWQTEMISDAIDDALDDDEAEEETEDLTNQVSFSSCHHIYPPTVVELEM